MVSVMLETASAHEPELDTVIVKFTDPLVLSFAPRLYTGLSMELFEKLPSPEVVHMIEPFV